MLAWTGLAMLTISISDLIFAAINHGGTVAGQAVAFPQWLQTWFNPEFLKGLQESIGQTMAWFNQIIPSSSVFSSIWTALVWVVWGIGALVLLVLAIVVHVVLRGAGLPAKSSFMQKYGVRGHR